MDRRMFLGLMPVLFLQLNPQWWSKKRIPQPVVVAAEKTATSVTIRWTV